MNKIIILIISILLIFPSILFAADCAWLLWEYHITKLPLPPYPKEPSGRWSLENALNSRNECLDSLLRQYFHLYELLAGSPKSKDNDIKEEVGPKLREDEASVYCLKSFYGASESEPVSKACKDHLARMVMDDLFGEGVKSKSLTHTYNSKDHYRVTEYELWCLPAGVDPKTIGNE